MKHYFINQKTDRRISSNSKTYKKLKKYGFLKKDTCLYDINSVKRCIKNIKKYYPGVSFGMGNDNLVSVYNPVQNTQIQVSPLIKDNIEEILYNVNGDLIRLYLPPLNKFTDLAGLVIRDNYIIGVIKTNNRLHQVSHYIKINIKSLDNIPLLIVKDDDHSLKFDKNVVSDLQVKQELLSLKPHELETQNDWRHLECNKYGYTWNNIYNKCQIVLKDNHTNNVTTSDTTSNINDSLTETNNGTTSNVTENDSLTEANNDTTSNVTANDLLTETNNDTTSNINDSLTETNNDTTSDTTSDTTINDSLTETNNDITINDSLTETNNDTTSDTTINDSLTETNNDTTSGITIIDSLKEINNNTTNDSLTETNNETTSGITINNALTKTNNDITSDITINDLLTEINNNTISNATASDSVNETNNNKDTISNITINDSLTETNNDNTLVNIPDYIPANIFDNTLINIPANISSNIQANIPDYIHGNTSNNIPANIFDHTDRDDNTVVSILINPQNDSVIGYL